MEMNSSYGGQQGRLLEGKRDQGRRVDRANDDCQRWGQIVEEEAGEEVGWQRQRRSAVVEVETGMDDWQKGKGKEEEESGKDYPGMPERARDV